MRVLAMLVLAFACSGSSTRARTTAEPADDPWARSAPPIRCGDLTGHADACNAQPGCVTGPPVQSCDGPVCTMGGPLSCLSCEDFAALSGRRHPACT